MHAAFSTRVQRPRIKGNTSQYISNSTADTSSKTGLGNQQSVQANIFIFNNLSLSSSLLPFTKYYYRLCKSHNQLLKYFHFFNPGLPPLPQHYLDQESTTGSVSQHKAHIFSFQKTVHLQNRADWNNMPFFKTRIFS